MAETLLVRVVTDASKFRSGMQGAQSSLRSFGNKASLLVSAPIALGVAKVVGDLGRVAKVEAQTGAVLKSTGMKAGVTAKQIRSQADAIETLTGVESEAIQEGQNLLLTFTGIRNGVGKGNDIFNQTTQIMTDMSVALGTDAKGSAIQLGKALNDPIKGVSALSRVGVSFTDKQKSQIAALVKSGRVMDAQKIILKELNTEFGGSAKAAGGTFAGSLKKAQNAVGNAAESVVTSLLPAIKKGADFIAKLAARFQELSPHAQKMIILGIGIAAALGPVVRIASSVIAVIRGIGTAMTLLSANPVVLIIAAVVAAGIAIWIFRDRVKEALGKVGRFFKALGSAIKEAIMAPIRWVVDKVLWSFGLILDGAARAFGWVPGLGPKLKSAKKGFDTFRDDVNRALGGIKGKRVKIDVRPVVSPKSVTVGLNIKASGKGNVVTLPFVGLPVAVGRASGGPVSGGRPYMVGERGPELFVPGRSGGIVPNHRLGGGTVVHNHFHIAGSVVTERQLGDVVEDAFVRAKRRNGRLAFQ